MITFKTGFNDTSFFKYLFRIKYYYLLTEFSRSVGKDWGLSILQNENQTRLVNSLLYARANIYGKSTENFPKVFMQVFTKYVFRVFSLFAEYFL